MGKKLYTIESVIGNKYGRLTVLAFSHFYIDKKNKRKYPKYLCQCECGVKCIVLRSYLIIGNTKSCGCLNKEAVHKAKYIHGLSNHRLMRIWGGMIKRCLNPKCKAYKDYGGRGISVCKEWLTFINFYTWAISNGYQDKLEIDRYPDNDGNYEPNNCRWATRKQQCNNTRSNVVFTMAGESHNVTQWCVLLNLKPSFILNRIRKGWDFNSAITIPKNGKRTQITAKK